MIYKNQPNQKIAVYAYDTSAGAPKTGDAANITAYINKDGSPTSSPTNDTNPTELDATNHPGIYVFDLTQAETNADLIILSAKSTSANVVIEPVIVYTAPATNTGVNLASTEHDAIADATLKRNVSGVEATAPEHSLCTVVLAMLESAVSGTTWTIKRTDGSTTHATKTVTTDTNADPITGVS